MTLVKRIAVVCFLRSNEETFVAGVYRSRSLKGTSLRVRGSWSSFKVNSVISRES